MEKILVATAIAWLSSFITGRVDWIEPDRFRYNWNDEITIRFLTGTDLDGTNWNGDSASVGRFDLYYSGVKDDLSAFLSGANGDSLQLKVLDEGTCMISFESADLPVPDPGPACNSWLRQLGYSDSAASAQDTDNLSPDAGCTCRSSLKTLFQVGDNLTNTFRQQTGLLLDIILQDQPWQIAEGDTITARVLFNKQPLSDYPLFLVHRVGDIVSRTLSKTDENGLLRFPVQPLGKWMICTAAYGATDTGSTRQWYRGALTWGYDSPKSQ